MHGKDKCRILKEIRQQIAENNDIEWVTSECRHQGNCKGTCPKCESEVRQLEAALARRKTLGKTVMVAGISAACFAGLTGCSVEDIVDTGTELLANIKAQMSCPPKEEETEPYIEYLDGEIAIPFDEEKPMDPIEAWKEGTLFGGSGKAEIPEDLSGYVAE